MVDGIKILLEKDHFLRHLEDEVRRMMREAGKPFRSSVT